MTSLSIPLLDHGHNQPHDGRRRQGGQGRATKSRLWDQAEFSWAMARSQISPAPSTQRGLEGGGGQGAHLGRVGRAGMLHALGMD